MPLLLAEERFAISERSERPRHFMPYVLLAVAVWNACTTWWLYCVSEPMESKLFSVIGPNIGNDLLFCVPWLVMRWARWFLPGRYVRWVLVVAWIAFERFHMNWDLSWPWLTLGNVFAEHPAWVQWYEFTGHLGGSLWVWLVNLGVAAVILNKGARESGQRKGVMAAFLIAVPFGASEIRYATFKDAGVPLEIVIVQPNIDPYNVKFASDPLVQLDGMLAQAEPLITPRTVLVVMPETALQELPRLADGPNGDLLLQGLWENDLGASQSVHRIRAFLSKYPGTSLVCGMSSAYLYPEGAHLPVTARVIESLGRGFDAYNAALLVRPDGTTESYMKSKLVPGVELLPFEEWLGPISSIALDLGGTTGSLGTQEEREVLSTQQGHVKFAPVICYESIYGDHVAAHVRNGAQFITIMTNDAWWSDSPAYRQHLAFGRLRAVETRRSIARSANTGISCFIDQRGDISEVTDWWVPAARKGIVLARADLTFFARFGDLIGATCQWLCGAWLIVMVILLFRRRMTRT
ncbi:MAG: apolipoprotein N-acyltransferase [Flavobacteriales bacterium]|nr:apolipoprotein N-acyltransferase [Flavobacteriales bacterium]